MGFDWETQLDRSDARCSDNFERLKAYKHVLFLIVGRRIVFLPSGLMCKREFESNGLLRSNRKAKLESIRFTFKTGYRIDFKKKGAVWMENYNLWHTHPWRCFGAGGL
jgi:hypothetical protein